MDIKETIEEICPRFEAWFYDTLEYALFGRIELINEDQWSVNQSLLEVIWILYDGGVFADKFVYTKKDYDLLISKDSRVKDSYPSVLRIGFDRIKPFRFSLKLLV